MFGWKRKSQATGPERVIELRAEAAKAHAAGNWKAALSVYRELVELAPDDFAVRQKVGDVLQRMGKLDEAIEAYQATVGLYVQTGQKAKAIAMCRVILHIAPDHTRTQILLGELYGDRPFGAPPPRIPRELMPPPSTSPLGPVELDEGGTPHRVPAPADGPLPVAPQQLARFPIFSRLDVGAFAALLAGLEMEEHAAGSPVFREGDDADSMYLLVEGALEVAREPRGGTREKIGVLEAGTFFGEIALLTDTLRTASVIATEDSLVLALDRVRLGRIAEAFPSVREAIAHDYSARMLGYLMRSCALFSILTDEQRWTLVQRFSVRKIEPDVELLVEGRPGGGLFVLLRGGCTVLKQAVGGTATVVREMGEGALFGEISLLKDSPATATVRTNKNSIVLALPRAAYRQILATNPAAQKFLEELAEERLAADRAFEAAGAQLGGLI